VDRRSFINLMAIAPFVGHTSIGAAKQSPNSRPKVVVVGAGLAGLVAALRLQDKGAEVTLLDSEPRVGGRIYSIPFGGTYANLGAQYVFESDNEYMNKYVKRMNRFSNEHSGLFDYDSGIVGILWDGQFVSGKGEEAFLKMPVGEESLRQWQRAGEKMVNDRRQMMKGREYIFDKSPESSLWRQLDSFSGAEYLADFHPDVSSIYNMFIKPEGGVGVAKTSALLLAGWYGGREGATYLVEGGNQELTEAMASDVISAGGVVRLSTEVNEIVNTTSGVSVSSTDGRTFDADYAVVTTTAPAARKIVKGLSTEKEAALDAVTYGASMQVALHIKDFTNDKKLASCLFHNEKVNAYLDQSKDHKENETVVCLNIAGDEAQRLDDEGVIQRVSTTLKKIYPEFDANRSIIDYAIKRWINGIATYPPGFLTQYHDALRAPSGRVHFGGDYTHSPELSGAAWSGVRAADAVLEAAG
jgi:monoamine oxidase